MRYLAGPEGKRVALIVVPCSSASCNCIRMRAAHEARQGYDMVHPSGTGCVPVRAGPDVWYNDSRRMQALSSEGVKDGDSRMRLRQL
eukprot:361871-Chlamydomonas_euryale.AAC.17